MVKDGETGDSVECRGQQNRLPGEKRRSNVIRKVDRLMGLIKDKLAVSTNEEKVKLLTLLPESWTISEVHVFLQCHNLW